MTYKEFVEKNLISEKEFNIAVELVPSCGTLDDPYNDYDNIYDYLINGYLVENTQYAYAQDVDENSKSFTIYDLEDSEVEKVFKDFHEKGWTINNEDDYLQNALKNIIIEKVTECEDLSILESIRKLLDE